MTFDLRSGFLNLGFIHPVRVRGLPIRALEKANVDTTTINYNPILRFITYVLILALCPNIDHTAEWGNDGSDNIFVVISFPNCELGGTRNHPNNNICPNRKLRPRNTGSNIEGKASNTRLSSIAKHARHPFVMSLYFSSNSFESTDCNESEHVWQEDLSAKKSFSHSTIGIHRKRSVSPLLGVGLSHVFGYHFWWRHNSMDDLGSWIM